MIIHQSDEFRICGIEQSSKIEESIIEIVSETRDLVSDSANHNTRLRRLFADLGQLKAKRSARRLYQLECDIGLGTPK